MRNLLLLIALFFIASCSTTRHPSTGEGDLAGMENRVLDTIVVESEKPSSLKKPEDFRLPVYNATPKRENDLLHTRLELAFDWANEAVIGKATLQLKPYFHPTRQLVLDAKGFEWKKVAMAGSGQLLQYTYDEQQITIDLGQTFTRDQTYAIDLEYIARPAASGGSAAITSDQGLFFINPRREEAEKPQQIWTQGETEWNSKWFPTIDKPNERCTQEVLLTVDNRFKTLSNGVLVSSTANLDGTRTDYWKMDQPHAPYLFMLAIGEYAVVKDKWRDKELLYYVEPEYEASARAIFAHTPEMLEFFSTKLGVSYPWQKFAQVIVRDYVSGAMENTTAVVFGEFIQKHQRELIDNTNEGIVAHEMFHHWFGDYVTCESWSNLTLNEGFANYSEYLWEEYKHGRDAADYHLLEEWQGYLGSAAGSMHDLIHFGYENNEDMFDAHSYNKGGAILHMLRNYVGDEAFFKALNLYLTQNAFKSVEAHQLRLAFEEVTGEDLNWFFNQWYFSKGHPELNIQYDYDATAGEATVRVEQTQNPDRMPAIFQLPVNIDVYAGGKVERRRVLVNQRVQTFRFKTSQKPDLINFDGDRMLLAEIKDNKTEEQLAFQFAHAPRFLDRFEAISKLMDDESEQVNDLLPAALQDPFWVIRAGALELLHEKSDKALLARAAEMVARDPHSEVRATALLKLSELDETRAFEAAKSALVSDSAYNVIGASLELLHQQDPKTGLEYARKLENEKSEDLLNSVGSIYQESGDVQYLPFFERNFRRMNNYNAIAFISSYVALVAKTDLVTGTQAAGKLRAIALDSSQSPWRRLAATKGLNDLRNEYRSQANDHKDKTQKDALEAKVTEISRMIDEIKTFETMDELKTIYQQLELIDRA